MKTHALTASLVVVLFSVLFCSTAGADALTGFSEVAMTGNALVSLRYGGIEYVVANGDLMLGETTRWYVPATGVPTLWVEGAAAPAATAPNSSDPKVGDVGSNADDWVFAVSGATDGMSSLDGIDYQETIFPVLTDTVFVFERGGNDSGTYQAILADGSLGAPVAFTGAANYADTGFDVGGQHAFGAVFTTDVRVKGVRISAPGHDALTVCAIPKPQDPKQSGDPQPADETTDVPRDVVLSWTPGEEAATVNGHVLYLSKDLGDVTGGANGVTRSDNRHNPGPLDFGATYYWRVDEVDAGGGVFPGHVWSFTVEPYAYPIQRVTATASSAQEGMGPENTVNGSGLNANDEHATEGTQMWLGAGAQPNWIQYAFDGVHKLHEMWVWNSNQLVEPFIGFGAREVRIEYSLDGSTWTELAGVPEFARGTGMATYTHNTTVPFAGVLAQYVKLTIAAAWGGLPQAGLSEVRFFAIPVQAREPRPADAATGIDLDAVMSWRSGREAASHRVYFSEDADAVTNATAPATTATDASFQPTALAYGVTYYWRVDEVNEAATPAVHEGPLWSFTTESYGVVDDFEGYNDDDRRIYDTWLDGYGTTTNGSQVGYSESPFAEQAIVHGGRQSMPLAYNNTAGPAMSEAERTFEEPQDWTRAGVATLAVHFRGAADNTTGSLYLKINGVKVAYSGDADTLKGVSWTQWNVDLASVNTNLKKVTTLAIGVDSGGQGIVYIDDIHLLPVVSTVPPAVTLTVAPAGSVTAAGNDGAVLSINGIDADSLVLGTTTTDYEKYADHPAAHADDLNLGTYASLDDSRVITVRFAVPVNTIFIIERGGNDSGLIQPLNAAGEPFGTPQPFTTADWFKPGVTIAGQAAGAMVIRATPSISGIMLLPPTGGATGVDPASISGVLAQ